MSEQGFWTPSELQAPPTDKPFWAYLHQTGIRKMVWVPDFYEDGGAYALDHGGRGDWYEPTWWAPLESIPDPAEEWAHCADESADV